MMNRFSGKQVISWVVIVALLATFAVVMLRTAWLSDDSFITSRQVVNFTNSFGITWFPGERVQAFTHPTWFFLLSAASFVTHDYFYTWITVSLLLSMISLIIFHLYCCKLKKFWLSIAALCVLLFSQAFLDYTSSGLENPLSYFLVAMILLLTSQLEEKVTYKKLRWFFLLLVLLVLNRLDYSIMMLPLAAIIWFRHIRFSRKLITMIPATSLLFGWFLFATIYFGFPLPNTFYAKLNAGFPLSQYISRGLNYFYISFIKDPVTLVLIALAIIAGVFAKGYLRALSGGLVLYCIYLVRIGGDFMQGRFFAVPAFLSVFILVTAFSKLESNTRRQAAVAILLPLLIAVSYSPMPLLTDLDYPYIKNIRGVADERSSYYNIYGLLAPERSWPEIVIPTAQETSSYSLLCGGMGKHGIESPSYHFLIDTCALTNTLTARLPAIQNKNKWRIGHVERKIPTNYGEVKIGNAETLKDIQVEKLRQDLQLAETGDYFSAERFAAMLRLNTGHDYGIDKAKYSDPAIHVKLSKVPIYLTYDQISGNIRDDGTTWDDPESYQFRFDSPIFVDFDQPIMANKIILSVDSNDCYNLLINGKIKHQLLPLETNMNLGSVTRTIELQEPILISRIRLYAALGDRRYAISYLIVENEQK
jgi:arabinofuranosyltransferase